LKKAIIISLAAVWLVACGKEEQAQPAAELVATEETRNIVMMFQEQERGVDTYLSRVIVTPEYLRMDDGSAEGDFILYDRKSRMIQSVAHDDANVLQIQFHEVDIKPPFLLNMEARIIEDDSAPLIGGNKPVQYIIMVNNERCYDVMLVPGLLEDGARAMAEYLEALAGEQARNLYKTPVEYQSACILSNTIFHAGDYLEKGFPIQESSVTGYERQLVDYQVNQELDGGLFRTPENYRSFSLEVEETPG
jgi:hypothetical protein